MKTRYWLLPFLWPALTFAQSPVPKKAVAVPDTAGLSRYVIVLNDSTRLDGRIVRADASTVIVRLANGKLTYVHPELYNRVELSSMSNLSGEASPDTAGRRRYRILLTDGTSLWGRIVRRDAGNVVVRLPNGNLSFVPAANFAGVEVPGQNPRPGVDLGGTTTFAPYLVFNETAWNPAGGSLYFRNALLFNNELQVGITRFWSVGASYGLTPGRLIWQQDASKLNFQLNTKLSATLFPMFRVGLRGTYQPAGQGNNFWRNSTLWNVQALATLGNQQQNVTFSYGRQFSRSDNDFGVEVGYVRLGAMVRLTPGVTVLTDNTFFTRPVFYNDPATQYTLALRIERPFHAFDFGLMGHTYANTYDYFGQIPDSEGYYVFPYIGYNLRINGR